MSVSLFYQGTSRRTRASGFTLHQGKFRLYIRENFFPKSVVKYWNKLPREGVESPSLEVFITCRCGTWGYGLAVESWQCEVHGWT